MRAPDVKQSRLSCGSRMGARFANEARQMRKIAPPQWLERILARELIQLAARGLVQNPWLQDAALVAARAAYPVPIAQSRLQATVAGRAGAHRFDPMDNAWTPARRLAQRARGRADRERGLVIRMTPAGDVQSTARHAPQASLQGGTPNLRSSDGIFPSRTDPPGSRDVTRHTVSSTGAGSTWHNPGT